VLSVGSVVNLKNAVEPSRAPRVPRKVRLAERLGGFRLLLQALTQRMITRNSANACLGVLGALGG
jgi:hypothetical protein